MAKHNTLLSPRLIALKQEMEAGNAAALDLFWQEIADTGAPLIEPITSDPDHVWVTFLWRAVQETHNIVVIGAFSGTLAGWRYRTNQMSRLLDTDLWYRTYRSRNDVRTTYELSPNDALLEAEDVEDWGARTATFQIDPLNPRQFILSADEEAGDEELVQSVLELPGARPQQWSDPRPYVPKRKLDMFRLWSNILDNRRRIWVYTPPGYSYTERYGLLVLLDGFAYISDIPTPTILDNLLAEGRIPPLIAVMVDSLTSEDREREYCCYRPFVDFLAEELLPAIRLHYHATSKPSQVIIGGSSYGGLAATYAGMQRPDVFGNALSQSGAVYWTPDKDNDFEWITRQFAGIERLPLRFYLDVGLLENNPRISVCLDGPTQLAATRHLRNILRAKGYEFHYREHNGGHDYICWRGTLADGILALVGRQ